MGRFEEAIAAFDQVLAMEPNHALTWNNRGNALIALERIDEAIKSYDTRARADARTCPRRPGTVSARSRP